MKGKLIVGSGIGGTVLIALLAFSLIPNTGLANAQPQLLNEQPAGTDGILKVKSLETKSESSKNRDIDVKPENKSDRILFRAVNKADKDSSLGIDSLKLKIDGAVLDISPPTFATEKSRTVAAKSSFVVLEFSINGYLTDFEEYPGRYNVTLLGYDSELLQADKEEDSLNGIEVEMEDLEIYKVEAQVVVGYDEAAIQSKKGHVLKSQNTQLAMDGDAPFVLAGNEKRSVVVSIINNNEYPVSGLVQYIGYNIMNAELTRAVGTDSIREYLNDECVIMEPGESKEIRTYVIGKDIPPLGGEGKTLSKKLGDGDAVRPGTYVVEIEGGTKPCITEQDERIPGMTFESMIVLEVKQ